MLTTAIVPQTSTEFATDVRNGLMKRGQKELPSKYLYDEVGSRLFEVISALPEYGVTRADERLLRKHAAEIVERVPGAVTVAELGSGSGKKTRWILEALSHHRRTAYYPIEIHMKPESIEGVVGQRHFQLHELDVEHNELRGTVRLPTFLGEKTYPFVVRGVQELWSMPAADQAVLMPMMMSCLESTVGNLTVQAVLSVDFRSGLVARR